MTRAGTGIRRAIASAGVVGLAVAGLSVGPAIERAGAGFGEPVQFDYTGTEQTYEVPEGVCQVSIDAAGAQGGLEDNAYAADVQAGDVGPAYNGVAPGKGGRVEATLAVTPGETLAVYVGGKGGDGSASVDLFADLSVDGVFTATFNPLAIAVGGAGGFNGGGAGGAADEVFGDEEGEFFALAAASAGGGGGGASDVRQGGNGLGDRVVVAGGGGGAGAYAAWGFVDLGGPDSGLGGTGGAGGAGNGGDGTDGEDETANLGGAGGAGGASATETGEVGLGADAVVDDDQYALVQTTAGGGGGGGLLGGGGGAPGGVEPDSDAGGGGGGGAGSALAPPLSALTDDYREGNGVVRITPAAPGVGCAPTLQVAKVVSGTSPLPFTVRVVCTASDITSTDVSTAGTTEDATLGYKADGSPDPAAGAAGWVVADGTWELTDGGLTGSACTVTETATGGAVSVSYGCAYTEGVSASAAAPSGVGCPGASSGPAADPVTVTFAGDSDRAVVTVTNLFPAVAAEVVANFTG